MLSCKQIGFQSYKLQERMRVIKERVKIQESDLWHGPILAQYDMYLFLSFAIHFWQKVKGWRIFNPFIARLFL